MKQYLLPEGGNFYKANMHIHTTISDGNMTPEEVKAWHVDHGYSIVAFTDHEALVPHNDLTDENFLAVTAVEVMIIEAWPGVHAYKRCYHLNLYAKDKNKDVYSTFDEKSFWPAHAKEFVTEECAAVKYRRLYNPDAINDLIARSNHEGFLVCYNHPDWSTQRYPDYAGLEGLWGIEVFNSGCNRSGHREDGQPFDDLLHLNKNVFPVCADDAHGKGSCGYGWIQVKADALDYDTVMKALERGDFYASTGPEIYDLYIEDGVVHASFSDAVEVFLRTERRVTRGKRASEDAPVNSVAFDINQFIEDSKHEIAMRYRPWFRFEIKDRRGNLAYTRAYFLDELGLIP